MQETFSYQFLHSFKIKTAVFRFTTEPNHARLSVLKYSAELALRQRDVRNKFHFCIHTQYKFAFYALKIKRKTMKLINKFYMQFKKRKKRKKLRKNICIG